MMRIHQKWTVTVTVTTIAYLFTLVMVSANPVNHHKLERKVCFVVYYSAKKSMIFDL